MGKKFRNRFRGLCPCTKTSPTTEVEDGGKLDYRRKVGGKEKQPNPHIVKTKSQQLSKFDQMIVEVEAMYVNLIEKLDHRHKSLNEITRVIFGGNCSLNTCVQTDQSKPNPTLTRGEQENGNSNQPNTNIESFEAKQKDNTHKIRKTLKRNSFSDAILCRWMTKLMAASDDNKVVQSTIKTADTEQTENDKARYYEVEEVIYYIDRVFIVDPRISHVSKMVKISKTNVGFLKAIHNMDQSICLDNAKWDSSYRMQIVNIPNIAIDRNVDTPCITADTFVSPHISVQPYSLDLRKVYRSIVESNQLSGYFSTSQRVEEMGNYYPRQVALALSFLAESIQQLHNSRRRQQMLLFSDFGHFAVTGLQAQLFRHQRVIKILVALSQFYPIDQQALVSGRRHAIQFSTVFGKFTPICLQALMSLISVAFGKYAQTGLRIQITPEFRLGQMPLVFGYPSQTSLHVRKSGNVQMVLISMALDFPTQTVLRLKQTTKKKEGHIAMVLHPPVKKSLRDVTTGRDPLRQITMALDCPAKTSLWAMKTGNEAIGRFALMIQYDGNKGTEHMGNVSLPFDRCLLNIHRVQQVRREQIRRMLLALGYMVRASFHYQKYKNGEHRKISAFGHHTLASLPAETPGNAYIGQIFVAFGNQHSTMELEMKQVSIVVDLSMMTHRYALKRSALKEQQARILNISEHFPTVTSQSHLAMLKEEINTLSNYGSGTALLVVGMSTCLRSFKGTKTAFTNSICFRLTNAIHEAGRLEMKTAQPFRDMFGQSRKVVEFAGLGVIDEPITVGPTLDRDESVISIDHSANIKVLGRILTPEPKTYTLGLYRCFANPAIIKKVKGKSTVGQIHGVFGICHIKSESAGMEYVVRRTQCKEDLSKLRQYGYTVQTNSYRKWKPTAEPTPDKVGLCRAADLIAKEDEHEEKTTDIDACSNKTPVISVRSVSVGSSTEDEMDDDKHEKARDDDESKHNDCLEGNSKTSHIEADSPEGNTDCDIAKTNSRTSHRKTQDKSTDTTDLPRPNTPAPVVAKGPVPGSTFGRCVLKHEVKGNLQYLMDKGVPIDESHARFMCINLLDILNYLHNRGVIHTNICARNIFFDEFGYPCLTGYDKCIYIGSDPHTRRKFRPPIEYCSPEQAMKTYVTEATDVFSVGVLCFNIIYGRSPHKGNTYKETRDNIINSNFVPKFEPDGLLSKSGKFFLVSCIRKDLDKRFSVRKCGTSLVRSVKWFNDYDEKALLSHNMPSPFLQLLID